MSLSFSITNPFFFSFSPILWLETWLKMFIFTQNRSFNFFLFFYHSFVFHHFLQNPRTTINCERVFIFNCERVFIRFPKPPVTQKCLKMIKRRILVKWPKTTFFSCFEATCSISEAASDSKMPKNVKTPNFDKIVKNNVFFIFRSHLFDFRKCQKSETLRLILHTIRCLILY